MSPKVSLKVLDESGKDITVYDYDEIYLHCFKLGNNGLELWRGVKDYQQVYDDVEILKVSWEFIQPVGCKETLELFEASDKTEIIVVFTVRII